MYLSRTVSIKLTKGVTMKLFKIVLVMTALTLMFNTAEAHHRKRKRSRRAYISRNCSSCKGATAFIKSAQSVSKVVPTNVQPVFGIMPFNTPKCVNGQCFK